MRKPLELHSHNTIGLAEMTYLDARVVGRRAPAVRLGRRGRRHLEPADRSASSPTCARSGIAWTSTTQALAAVSNYFTRLAEAEGLPVGRPQGFDAAYLRHQLPGGTVGTMRRHLAESACRAPGRRGDRGAGPRARGAGLADRDDAVRADADHAGGDERHGHASATAVIPDEVIRYALGPLRPAQRADRSAR